MFFDKAKPVWATEYIGKWNTLLSFEAKVEYFCGNAQMHVAADNFYRLFINGEFVFHGPQRCGKGVWRVDRLDVTEFLKKGSNKIEILVQHHGVTSFEYITQNAFLQAELFIDGVSACHSGIDGDFFARREESKEQVVERFSQQRPFIEVWHLPKKYSDVLPLTKVDGVNLTERTAPMPTFQQRTFQFVKRGKGEILPVKKRTKIGLTASEDEPNYSYRPEEIKLFYVDVLNSMVTREFYENYSGEMPISIEENEFEILKLENENTGFIKCKIECEEPSTLYFTFDETLTDGDVLPCIRQRDEWTCNLIPLYLSKGEHQFFAIEPRTIHYLKVFCAKGKLKVTELSLVEYVSGVGLAEFSCNDEALERIFNSAKRTFEQNAVDIFMDCPSRERAGWLCDSFFTGRVEKALTGKSDIEKGFLENFFIASDFPRLPKGMLPMCYPSDPLSNSFIPNWAMFLVLQVEEYFARTGDKEMLEIAKKRLYELEEYFCQFINSDGLLENLDGWIFVEWSQANKWVQNVSFPTNMMYYACLKAMSRMYNDNGLSAKADKIKEAIIRLSFNGTFFRDHQVIKEDGERVVPEDITEVCQYYAFFTGVADKESFPGLLKIIINDFGPGHKCTKTHLEVYPANAFIGNFLRMEILSESGLCEQIMEEIKEYFDYMALKTGTLWENDTPHASCNHGFASHIACVIFRNCLGIEKIDELNKKIYLNNNFVPPENAAALIPLKNGSMKVTVDASVRHVEITGDYKIG